MMLRFHDLIEPFTESEFATLLRQRKLELVRGTIPHRYEALLDWPTVNHLLETPAYPLECLRVVRESIPVPESFYIRKGRIDQEALAHLMGQGVSLIFNRLEQYVPTLGALCRNLARDTGEQIVAGAIVTSGAGGALKRHHDKEDLAIFQIAGTKRWHVYAPPVVNPAHGLQEPRPPQTAPIFDEILRPGDFLFLPAGYWHDCENGPERSLHVGVSFDPPHGRHLVLSLATEWLADETFRRPLTRHLDAQDLADHESALKSLLAERARNLSLRDFLARRAALDPPSPGIVPPGNGPGVSPVLSRQ